MSSRTKREIILCEADSGITREDFEARIEGVNIRILRSDSKDLAVRYEEYVKNLFVEVKSILKRRMKGNVLIQVVVFTKDDKELFRGMGGLLKTAQLENPRLLYQVIQLPAASGIEEILEKLEAESRSLKDTEIRYVDGVRYVKRLEETSIVESDGSEIPWKEGGVYLITGGAGGLGFLFAEEIARKVKAPVLILTGRSEINGKIEAQLKVLRGLGARGEYRRVDITDKELVQELVVGIEAAWGGINGIFHSAGVIRDNYIIHKTEEEFDAVLKPKVTGLINLDTCTREMNLDFIVLFSSQAGESGNPGQADYAAANAFMDDYAGYRNKLAASGERRGKTVSINWPLWEDGGMHVDEEIEKMMFKSTGMIPIKSETGIRAVYRALSEEKDQVIVVEGDVTRLRSLFMAKDSGEPFPRNEDAAVESWNVKIPVIQDVSEGHRIPARYEGLKNKAEAYFKKLLSSVLKLPVNRIESDAPMEKYGIDSVMIMKMTDELEKAFGSLSKTLFFEYQDIQALTRYFLESYEDKMAELLGLGLNKREELMDGEKESSIGLLETAVPEIKKRKRLRFSASSTTAVEKHTKEDIAIIGVSGRYPQAKSLDDLWANISGGKDCITEIPEDRWDYWQYYDEDKNRTGKSTGKWGGFLNDVDKFDPLFFNITPREAEFMDPQERLFLECVMETLEDAGYTKETLSKYQGFELEGNVGVYVGVMYDEYQLYGAQEQAHGRMLALNGIMSSVANRVSYFFNFHGPSIGLNTMCSSSLVAIHLACQSIHQGECQLAIAGGVNVSIHPNKYLLLNRGNFLSSKGKCEAFGKDGDGYVPGEGVGAILLKPLSRAIEDGDQIYGVIKGSATNHGGKTNGYTVPNPNAQASMIKATLQSAGVDARKISYIEAHGTGTSLGDPIEITALTKAFEEHTSEKQYCAIGSVKSNIGHLESAAGIAGVTKVLLQMKHGKLAPSLHSQILNPNIDFGKTPFKVQQECEEWKRPVIENDGVKKEYPRIAGVSAFGAGGSNAHLVIEEYIPEPAEAKVTVTAGNPAVIILSGRGEEKLKERAEQLLNELEKGKFEEKDLPHIAYTLQVGREAMESRMGMTVISIDELKEKLRGFLADREDTEGLYIGHAKQEKDTLSIFREDEDLQRAIDLWISKRKYGKLLDFWVKGMAFQWERLYEGTASPKRVSLPAYPFARERYWIPKGESGSRMIRAAAALRAREDEAAESQTVSARRQAEPAAPSTPPQHDRLKERTVHYFKTLLSSVSDIPVDRIEPKAPLESYGIDSIMIKQISVQLEVTFGPIPMTLFFEYQDLQSLAEHFVKTYTDQLAELFGLVDEGEGDAHNAVPEAAAEPAEQPRVAYYPINNDFTKSVPDVPLALRNEDIAIIGLSGRYPRARNIRQYWENLKAGLDCVSEIPKDRWDVSLYYDADKSQPGKLRSKWGGFIDDVDKFDPLFFHISPEEAQFMDPQERLFLECVYETLEDAGYTSEALKKYGDLGLEANVGVFVGVTFLEYHLYGIQSQMKGKPVALSGIASSIANRASYYFNFHGPSMSIDSMCSSSLSALHVACDSIKQGGCRLAVVGGVNLSLHPNKYLFLNQYNFLSTKGRCESFGNNGDGYVPGEGVGAILLKPLRQAEADGDHVYGVIKSTALNHGGKTNGYSVPTPVAQAGVISKAMRDANVNPRTISYIEAHGTGTSLGDPIEIAGLAKAFGDYTDERAFCAIGSAKSNIGHLEAAAGIAGITKVLLQMKHKQLVPSLHSEVLNTNIDFRQTPFKVQRTLEEWTRPLVQSGGEQKECPRIAGISSFGAGGANAHVIIEEYIPETEEHPRIAVTVQNPAIIVLSAKKEGALNEQAKRLLEAIGHQSYEHMDLADIAYTLQVGRESMELRMGIIVTSIDDLREKLKGFLAGRTDIDGLHRGQGRKQKNVLSLLTSHVEIQDVVEKWVERKKYAALLDLWVSGYDMDWEWLYPHGNLKPKRISLPTYPFERERYWLPEGMAEAEALRAPGPMPSGYLHPLVQRNTSKLDEQRFSSTFTGKELFFGDRDGARERIISGGTYLEMARAAVAESVSEGEGSAIILKNVMWSRPFAVKENHRDVHIGIYREEDGEIGYEIYSEGPNSAEETIVHCQGRAVYMPTLAPRKPERMDIGKLQTECTELITGDGSGQQGGESIYAGEVAALVKLVKPEFVHAEARDYVLHPSVVNAAIQAVITLTTRNTGSGIPKISIPFAIDELEAAGHCAETVWAVIRKSHGAPSDDDTLKFDMDLCDETGIILVRMKGLALKTLEAEGTGNGPIGTIMLQPVWKESGSIQTDPMAVMVQREIILCEAGNDISPQEVEARIHGAACRKLSSGEEDLALRYEAYTKQLLVEVRSILASRPKGNVLFQLAVFTDEAQGSCRGLGGLLKTAQLENPRMSYQMIQLPAGMGVEEVVDLLEANSWNPKEKEIRYENGIRYVKSLEEIRMAAGNSANRIPFREGGVYLLTGGAGGLGLAFAEEIANQVKDVTLVLTGRSEENDRIRAQLNMLTEMGARAEYRQADISEKDQVQELVSGITASWGGLHGIFHIAGVIRDNYIIHKTAEEVVDVLKPKVSGLLHLDMCTKDLNLDFIVLFSSGAGEFGNPGQADYAAANAFMDVYASYRNEWAAAGRRQGRTLSINWPLWENGGMHVDQEIEKIMFESKGMTPMKTEIGIQALYEALAQDNSQVVVLAGDTAKIRTGILAVRGEESDSHQPDMNLENIDLDMVKEKVVRKLTVLLGETIKLHVNQIDIEEPFENYGLDSIKLTLMNQKLTEPFKDISNTLFFEYRTLSSLGGYLAAEYPHACMKWVGEAKESPEKPGVGKRIPLPDSSIELPKLASKRSNPGPMTRNRGGVEDASAAIEPIAVIGMSGRFPMAKNLEEFWENLKTGKDCITELPKERWPVDGFYDPRREEAAAQKKSCSKWGGFLEGFADFDPLFFNISPAEAERMDPQERIFLEECWKAVEDAGYVPSKIAESLGKQIGVFAGVTKTGFSLWNTPDTFYGTSFSSLVNRVSYFMDLRGPSISVDTMCSSSLVALHQACESIRHGQIRMAIVGAVNLYLHPSNYTTLTQAGLLSDSPRSSVFGAGGTGFIPSEGVGAVVLKRLSEAEKDKDHIWAVIRGSSVSHSGRTNGYNVPDPTRQADVIQQALNAANVDPRSIRHIEAATSGSEMADAIEMSALTKVFRKYRDQSDRHYTMGSVKSVIGHGESVSGMAQLIKALLQLKHGMLCPTSLPKQLNPKIPFQTLPFRIETELAEWPKADTDGSGEVSPRRIGINNFGAGGVYAHVIVEEYGQPAEHTAPGDCSGTRSLFVFSAKTNHSLTRYLKAWRDYAAMHPELDVGRLACILQTKREAMKRRVAVIARSREELLHHLEDYLQDAANPQVYVTPQDVTEDLRLDKLLTDRDWPGLARLWVNGAAIPWERLYGNETPKQIPQLPTYPFRQKQFWVNGKDYEELHKDEPEGEDSGIVSLESILGVRPELAGSRLTMDGITEAGFIPLGRFLISDDRSEPAAVHENPPEETSEPGEIQHMIQEILYDILYLDDLDEFDPEVHFMELGLDSILMSQFIHKLNARTGLNLRETILFDYSNAYLLAEYVDSKQREERGKLQCI